jgi:hypothetical protein
MTDYSDLYNFDDCIDVKNHYELAQRNMNQASDEYESEKWELEKQKWELEYYRESEEFKYDQIMKEFKERRRLERAELKRKFREERAEEKKKSKVK